MPVAAIPALIAAGQAGYQLYQSNKQKKLAEKIKPGNYTPPSTQEAVSNARREANATAGPGYARGLERIRQSTASTIDAAKRIGGTPGQLQQAVADTDAREKELLKDLEVNNEQFRMARKQDLNRSLMIKGQYEQASKNASDAAKSALTGASMQNQYNAVSGLGESLIYSLPDNAISPLGKKPATAPGATGAPATDPASAPGRPAYTGFNPGTGRYNTFSRKLPVGMKMSPMEQAMLYSRGFINGY